MDEQLRALWTAYLTAESAGRRRAALSALEAVLDVAEATSAVDQVAVSALREHERRRDFVLREPLRSRAVVPYLRSRIADPQAIWAALRIGAPELLERYEPLDALRHHTDEGTGSPSIGALTYALAATGEDRWWRALLEARLAWVRWGTHHLSEGVGLVDASAGEYVTQLCAALAVADQAPPGVLTEQSLAELGELWELLRDWLRFEDQGRPGGDFPGWCRSQGSGHRVARGTAPTAHHDDG